MQIVYDAAAHTFFCLGRVDAQTFLEALWEQWDTDYCAPELLSRHIRHGYVTYNVNGFWEETADGVEATILSGEVINLGPAVCPRCGHLMALESRDYVGRMVSESWSCPSCGESMSHRGRAKRPKRR